MVRELALDPLKVSEETAIATMNIAIVAIRKRLGVSHRPWNMRKPARAPLAPDIASNAHPAHIMGSYNTVLGSHAQASRGSRGAP